MLRKKLDFSLSSLLKGSFLDKEVRQAQDWGARQGEEWPSRQTHPCPWIDPFLLRHTRRSPMHLEGEGSRDPLQDKSLWVLAKGDTHSQMCGPSRSQPRVIHI